MADLPFEIKRAERKQARLRLALGAASNGGKTYSGLEVGFGLIEELIAQGVLSGTLEGKLGVVDTERKSSHLYSHLGPYDVIELGPPFSVEKYERALRQFEMANYSVVMLDSISHAWVGAGGVLSLLRQFEDHERFRKFDSVVNPAQDGFVDVMLRSPCHIIATMRSKTAWVMEQVEKRGRTVHQPKRVGMAPIQRPGIEYEFTTMLDLETDTHVARVLKNRCPVFGADKFQPVRLTREHGRQLARWLLEGAPPTEEIDTGTPLERAQATLATGFRAMHRCENLPDLARVVEDTDRKLKGFAPGVPKEEVMELRRKLVDEKDLRKRQLGAPGERAPVMVDPAHAMDLETMLQEAEVTLEECREQFGVERLALLPAERLQDVASWICARAADAGLEVRLPARLGAAGVKVGGLASAGSRFADMADDIPWK